MHFKTSYFVVFAMLLAAGCKKAGVDFSGAKVSSTTNFIQQFSTTYTYNSQGDIDVALQSTGTKTVYQYDSTQVSAREYTAGGAVVRGINYFKNGTYADSAVGVLQAQNSSYHYVYNSDGRLTQQKTYVLGALTSVVDYAISNKNVAWFKTTRASDNTYTTTYFLYDGTHTSATGNQNFGMGFIGVSSNNVPVRQVEIAQNGDTLNIWNYRYSYDSESRVDTMSTYDRHGNRIDSVAYTYY